jgi:hypothetical protein
MKQRFKNAKEGVAPRPGDLMRSADFAEIEKRAMAFLVANPEFHAAWLKQQEEALKERARRDGFLF